MSELQSCNRCGAELSAETTGGLCPRCLMAMNFDSRTMPEGEEPPQLPPLSPEEMREHFPQYEILECLGRGGMGVVYKARQKALDRQVAIKVLAGEWQGEPGFAERFEGEAKILAQMSHPNIVTVHDFGEAGGLYYIVMEYIDGVNLRDLLREGTMEPEQALAIVPPVCEALEYAHGKGVVHRDIKPENLLLDRDGRIKIADFGIASLVGVAGEKAGTPPYMAPEQASGGADRRADIYALGVVLYEMLTGERPTVNVVEPSRKVAVDVRIDEMVLRALEKEPERRYQTAGEFRTVVETIRQPSAKPELQAPARPRGMFRRFWWVLVLALFLGPLLGLGAGAVWGYVAPRKYEATAMMQASPASGVSTPSHFATLIEALQARKTLEAVAEELDLARRWDLPSDDVRVRLRTMIDAQNLRGTDLVRIRVRDTNPEGAAQIANGLVDALVARADALDLRVVVHERATRPTKAVSPNLILILLVAAGAGLLLAPVAGLLLMTILHRLLPGQKTAGGEAAAGGVPRGALWLLIAALLGTPLLFAIVPGGRHEWVLVFAALCALGSFGCGVASWRTRLGRGVASFWIAIVVAGLAAAVFYYFLARSGEADAREAVSAAQRRAQDEARALEAEMQDAAREAFVGRWKWEEEGTGDVVWLLVPTFRDAVVMGSDQGGKLHFRCQLDWKLDGEVAVFREAGEEVRVELGQEGREVHFIRAGDKWSFLRKTSESPGAIEPGLIGIEDSAIEMIAAIREGDDAALRSLAVDRTPGWRDALPAFAGELRERHRHLTGSEDFGLWPTEVLVQGKYGLARCTGSDALDGKCVVLSFVKTDAGWRNCLLRSGTDEVLLRRYLAELQAER